MRVCRFDDDRLGLVEGAQVLDVTSALETLFPGDLIFTGTPEGVGPVRPGDEIRAGIEGVGEFAIRVASEYAG